MKSGNEVLLRCYQTEEQRKVSMIQKESVCSKLIKKILRFIKLKQRMESDTLRDLSRTDGKRRFFFFKKTNQRKSNTRFWKLPLFPVAVRRISMAEAPCYQLLPVKRNRQDQKRPDRALIYLHGGSYMNGLYPAHWQYAAKMSSECDMEVWLPDYPLAPQGTYRESFAMLEALYRRLRRTYLPEQIWLMGDSAGGGFALAFAQQLLRQGEPSLAGIILFSPWLDVSMENPEIAQFDSKDPFLNRKALQAAGYAYAGGNDVKKPEVSPIYGVLEGLKNINLFVGTCDLLCADAQKFQSLCRKAEIELNYYEYPDMVHDFMLGPLPEAKQVYQQVLRILNADKNPCAIEEQSRKRILQKNTMIQKKESFR